MKKTVLTFGLIAGAILSAMMLSTLPFMDRIGFEKGELIGYTTMVLAFMLVFFGIKSYRDNVGGGNITFGRGVAVGLLITAVAAACYVVTWEIIYFQLVPDFLERYGAYALEKARAAGASAAELEKQRQDLAKYAAMYANPFVNAALTLIEPLPVGVVITLISAGALRTKPDGA